jgi:hypothetical protein
MNINFIKKNFMAVCILTSALMLSIAIMISSLCNRFYLIKDSNSFMVINRLTGSTYIVSGKTALKLTIRDIEKMFKETLIDNTK